MELRYKETEFEMPNCLTFKHSINELHSNRKFWQTNDSRDLIKHASHTWDVPIVRYTRALYRHRDTGACMSLEHLAHT
jgi:hypothetical protein